jgi:hypothetical protein
VEKSLWIGWHWPQWAVGDYLMLLEKYIFIVAQ